MNPAYSAGAHAALLALSPGSDASPPPEGEGILEKAVIQYGHERGGRMRQRAITDGLPFEHVHLPALPGSIRWIPPSSVALRCTSPTAISTRPPTKCPWSTKWKELGLTQYCGVYCRHVDRALAEGFDPSCVIDSMANLTEGAPHCDLYFRGVNIARPEVQVKMHAWGGRIKNSAALKNWDYQLAHTYVSLENSLKAALPGEVGRS